MVADRLAEAEIPYFVSGSMASMMYGEVRMTRDVDVVIAIGPRDVPAILRAFEGDEYYIDPGSVRRAAEVFDQFNVIHPSSGLKVDFMVVDDDGYNASRLSRRRLLEVVPGRSAWFAAPEDVILKKLLYYKEGRSEKHLRDIASIFKTSGDLLNRAYTEYWAMRLGVTELWQYVVARAEGREPGPAV